MPTFQLLIKGKVQGVFYRSTARHKARELNISGWIRNTNEGDVEAMISGEDKNLKLFIEWCKTGPAEADVTDVTVTQQPPMTFNSFEIKRHS